MRIGIQLDEWVIMPNHLHGIILILNNDPVETHCNASPSGKNNLSNIIRGFKAASATRIHHAGYKNFRWQSRFYDHIVGTEEAFQKVREYIGDNPLKWDLDNENRR
jgi:REP element-mobilizing transposase RayT